MHTTATTGLTDDLTATYGHLLPPTLIEGAVRSAVAVPRTDVRSAEAAARADVAALAEAVRRSPAAAGAW